MKHIIFNENHLISFIGIPGMEIADAILEAITFCKENDLKECELECNGFLFDIEPTSVVNEKLAEYNSAINTTMQ